MPAPKDPIKNAEWRAKLSKAGKGNVNAYGHVWSEEEKAQIRIRSKELCTLEEREIRRLRAIEQGFGKSNAGRTLSDSHKEAMVSALRGKTYEEIYGADAINQKQVRKISNKETYAPRIKQDKVTRNKHNADAEYRHWRLAVFTRDDYCCQDCKNRGGYLHAHHDKPWAGYPELRYEISNGVTLCVDCHKIRHQSIKIPRK